jgi:hypothetical protein
VRCCHCGIRFFTHPRSAGRRNLRCPFGCRQHRRRQRANARSRKYYRTRFGARKKKRLNGRRSRFSSVSPRNVLTLTPPTPLGQPLPNEPSDVPSANSSNAHSVSKPASQAVSELAAPFENVGVPLEGLLLNEPTLVSSRILPYVRMVASVIEGRTISRDELMDALRKRMRQHRIGQLPRREYVLCYLNQHPP